MVISLLKDPHKLETIKFLAPSVNKTARIFRLSARLAEDIKWFEDSADEQRPGHESQIDSPDHQCTSASLIENSTAHYSGIEVMSETSNY